MLRNVAKCSGECCDCNAGQISTIHWCIITRGVGSSIPLREFCVKCSVNTPALPPAWQWGRYESEFEMKWRQWQTFKYDNHQTSPTPCQPTLDINETTHRDRHGTWTIWHGGTQQFHTSLSEEATGPFGVHSTTDSLANSECLIESEEVKSP